MTTNADLIAEASLIAGHYEEGDATGDFIEKLAERLEAAEQRAELAEANLEVEEDKNAGYRVKNEQLAAVVEKVREYVMAVGGLLDVREIIDSAPADILRELKADVWDEGEEAGMNNQANWDGWLDTKPPIANPYRAREEQGRG